MHDTCPGNTGHIGPSGSDVALKGPWIWEASFEVPVEPFDLALGLGTVPTTRALLPIPYPLARCFAISRRN